MKEFKVLKLLDACKPFFEKRGLDYGLMRKILKIKFTLDQRRAPSISANTKTKKKEHNGMLRSLPFYLFMGIFLAPMVLLSPNPMIAMSIFFGIFLFLMMTSLISDFSAVLLDVRDKAIILTKAVDKRTFNAAKIIHISVYMILMTLAISLPALIALGIKNGPLFSLLSVLALIFIDFFIITLTGLIYLLILRFLSGDKLKDVINYVQIILSITLAVGYQVLIRMFDFSQGLLASFTPHWWTYLLPPVWFAAPFELLFSHNTQTHILIYTGLAIFMPLLSIILYFRLIPVFEKNLQKLNEADSKAKKGWGWERKISRFFFWDPQERTLFHFFSDMFKRERNFKLRVYPNLALSVIFPFLILGGSNLKNITAMHNPLNFLGVYLCGLSIITTLSLLPYSESYKGAFVYKLFPLSEEKIRRSVFKTMFLKLQTPVFLFVSLIFFLLLREKILWDIPIAYLALYLSVYFIGKLSGKALPFSVGIGTSPAQSNLMFTFVAFFIDGGLALFHFLSSLIPYGKPSYLLILLLLNAFFWHRKIPASPSLKNKA